jgi:aminoglycoside 3-N-acetyltransferase
MSEQYAINRNPAKPQTIATLQRDLEQLGVRPGMTLLVHASLSSIGWVCGGPVAVIDALQRAIGPAGTLVMPAHSSEMSEPSHWCNPPVPEAWWPIIRESMPPFDPALTPTRGMGTIAECFRTMPDVWRSAHPQTSFVARGPCASFITSGHAIDSDLGERSPLARIYELDGWLLLLGVWHDCNTSLHLAEHRANFPSKRVEVQGAPVTIEGERRWITFPTQIYHEDDFEEVGAAFEAQDAEFKRERIGAAVSRLIRQRPLVDFAARWFEQHRS